MALDRLHRGELQIPPGCSVTYELVAIKVLKNLDWTIVDVKDGEMELNIVKIAVNVARRPSESGNILPGLLRGWFGPAAGQPGKPRHQVLFRKEGDRYRMTPLGVDGHVLNSTVD